MVRPHLNPNITILTHDSRWRGLAPTVRRAADAALAISKKKKLAVTFVLTNDAAIKSLNKQFRGKDKPTNVLSFPDGSVEDGITQLGDVVLAYETMFNEAHLQKKSFKHHLTHLSIHGVLHLLGFDHENEADAETMESLEIHILARMGIANPYESR